MGKIHTKDKQNLSRYILSVLFTIVVILNFATPASAETISVDDFNSGANNWVTALSIQPDGKVLVGGYFSYLAGTPRSRIGRLNPDSTIDSSFNPGANNIVICMAVQADGKILVGGAFTILGGMTRNFIGRLNSDGTIDTSFNPGANGSVHSFSIQPDGKIIVGGEFTSMGGSPRSKIARLNSNGTLDATFNPGVGMANISQAVIYTTAVQADGKILIGGEFSTLAGTTRNRIGRVTPNGAFDSTFNPSTYFSTVKNIIIQSDGKILVGEGSLKRLNEDGTLDPDFIAGTNQTASSAISLQVDGRIILSGNSNGHYVKWLNIDGSPSSVFNPGSNSYINFIELQPNGMLFAAGNFSVLGSAARNNIGRLQNDISTTTERISSNTNGSVLTWQRTGSGPEISFSTFEFSTDGINYTYLGTGSRFSEGWEISNQSLPTNENLNIRVRGYYGSANGSMSIIEAKENIYITAPSINLIVTKNTDTNDGVCNLDCSLREALANASNSDTITFIPSLAGQTIHLQSELVVGKSITIDGSNLAVPITISGDMDNDGDGDVHLVKVSSSGDLIIRNLVFTKGYSSSSSLSGGIENLGHLTVYDSRFSYNIGGQGGAIKNDQGTINITGCEFASNLAGGAGGGAVFNGYASIATINNSSFTQNTATGQFSDSEDDGAGGAISSAGTLTVNNSEFVENSAFLGAGAILAGGDTTISDTSFSSNTAGLEGGGAILSWNSIIVENSLFSSNIALGYGSSGGAINHPMEGNLTILQSTFSDNSASGGGAISLGKQNPFSTTPTLSISNTAISNNHADFAGGLLIISGNVTINNTAISENSSEDVGGIVNSAVGNLTLINTTVNNNSINNTSSPAGILTQGPTNIINSTIANNLGTAIQSHGETNIINSTIAGNIAYGVRHYSNTLILKNSIIANNWRDCTLETGGVIGENHNNLIEENFCGIASLDSDPNLGPLANNGGSTWTMELLPGSPAIDAGNDTTCESAPVSSTSQNGVIRPQGSHCDIGAFEYSTSLPDLIITNVTISPTVPLPNQTFEISITIKNQGGIGSANTIYRDVYINRDPSTLINPVTGCPPPGDFFRSDSYANLPAGMTDTKTVTITGGLPLGNHQLWFYVDSRCLVDEDGGSNNAP